VKGVANRECDSIVMAMRESPPATTTRVSMENELFLADVPDVGEHGASL